MAILISELTGQSCLLRANHVLGRDSNRCDTVIALPFVSRIHATIRWRAPRWELHVHGRNGALVGGTFIGEGRHVVLQLGDIIHFGSAACAPWQVANLDAPADGPAPDTTAALPRPAQFESIAQRIEWRVSRDEEHVSATLHTRGAALDLGMRAHHYCLVTLARKRHADALAGYDNASQGWIELEVLAHMLGLDLSHVNVQIHRARMQFGAVLTPGSPELVERRRGGVRFGALPFSIVRADTLECQSPTDEFPESRPAPALSLAASELARASAN
ncbi:DNA-binding protein [Trinickia dabaoshanensis]|uniref:DNA-binding protein n=1 Tax=Trinickia dabaoshanensis TaxID=564714 RepID=A0A2N7VCF9_9BURK|nr:DNA-binding protein [Trinickia dabaoshanensis]